MVERKSRCLISGCKGSIIDVLPLILLVFIFAISAVVGFLIYDGMKDNGFFTILNASAPMEDGFDRAFVAMDWMVGFLFFGAAISSLVGAILIRSHPAFFFLSIVVLIIETLISVVFSDIWFVFITGTGMAGALANFQVADWVLSYLPVSTLVVALVMGVIMYAVNPFGQ